MDAGILVPLGFFAMVATIAVGTPLARAFARRMDHEAKTKIPPEVTSRLERIEQAVDAIAIEVERISEGQRFTTKLLTERAADANRLAEPRRPT
ncbi:MAG TPA: hypothetical protein VFU01_01750 [Gemmatimonadaceae bacterium]|nr:hypothetical protein [Gemmatimonadaceae bacterium]